MLSLGIKTPVRCCATSPITLSGLQTVDGIALDAGDRVLVAGQDNPGENGFYVAARQGWSKAADDDIGVGPGTLVLVTEGGQYALTLFYVAADLAFRNLTFTPIVVTPSFTVVFQRPGITITV